MSPKKTDDPADDEDTGTTKTSKAKKSAKKAKKSAKAKSSKPASKTAKKSAKKASKKASTKPVKKVAKKATKTATSTTAKTAAKPASKSAATGGSQLTFSKSSTSSGKKDSKKGKTTKDDKKQSKTTKVEKAKPTKVDTGAKAKAAKDAKKTKPVKAEKKQPSAGPARKSYTIDHEDWVQSLNRWAWMAPFFAGLGLVFWGLWWGIFFLGWADLSLWGFGFIEFFVYVVLGIIGIIVGLAALSKVKPLIAARNYAAAEHPCIIWAIIGLICVGAGGLLLLQFILIKSGKK